MYRDIRCMRLQDKMVRIYTGLTVASVTNVKFDSLVIHAPDLIKHEPVVKHVTHSVCFLQKTTLVRPSNPFYSTAIFNMALSPLNAQTVIIKPIIPSILGHFAQRFDIFLPKLLICILFTPYRQFKAPNKCEKSMTYISVNHMCPNVVAV